MIIEALRSNSSVLSFKWRLTFFFFLFLLCSGSLRTVLPAPVGLHTSDLSGVIRRNWIQSHWECRQVRSALCRWDVRLGNCPLSRWTLWESNFTLSTFFKISLNGLLFYRIFHSQLCTVFNLRHSKDGGHLRDWDCELLLNCKRSESCFQGVTCVGAQTALDTDRRCELPRLRTAGFCLAGGSGSAVIPRCGVSQSRCVTMALLLKTPGNLKKKKKKKCGCCFRVPCCNTGKDHKRVDVLQTEWSSERSLLTTFRVFCGFAGRKINGPRYHG